MRWHAILGLALGLLIGCAEPGPPPPKPPAPPPPVAPAPPPVSAEPPPPPAPSIPPCEVPRPGTPEGPLTEERLEKARAAEPHPERLAFARTLGVSCDPEAPNFDVAFAQAIARFQRRYGRFEDEVTGIVNWRTNRGLKMVHPELRGPDHRCQDQVKPTDSPLPSCLLYWPKATDEQRAFMRRVYEIAQARAAKRRPFVLAADEVDVIETGPCPGKPADVKPDCRRAHWAQRDAAAAAKRLLDAARADFDADRKKHGQRNLMVYTGYRSAVFQVEIWEYHFPQRYAATRRARRRARGGEHGEAAALLLAQYYAGRTAPPGHSLHNRGLAIDFGCVTDDGGWIGSTGSFRAAWKTSGCFRWLERNAGRFGFRLNGSIDEPWHWEYHGPKD